MNPARLIRILRRNNLGGFCGIPLAIKRGIAGVSGPQDYCSRAWPDSGRITGDTEVMKTETGGVAPRDRLGIEPIEGFPSRKPYPNPTKLRFPCSRHPV